MKKNIISIDLDDFDKREVEILKEKQVPTPCTLTDAVKWCEKYSQYITIYQDGSLEICDSSKFMDSEQFKKNHLYKETLEDGIYEAKTRKRDDALTYIWFVSDGKAHFDKELTSRWGDASKLINPKKIAEL